MKIDDRLEARVRRILGGVVQAKPHEFDAALKALPNDKVRAQALELAITICAYMLIDIYEGRPTPEDLELAAEDVVAMEHWVPLEQAEVNTFLNAILNGTPLAEVLDPTTAVMLTFIVTGSVLAASPKISKDETWNNYLDRVEAGIEATAQK